MENLVLVERLLNSYGFPMLVLWGLWVLQGRIGAWFAPRLSAVLDRVQDGIAAHCALVTTLDNSQTEISATQKEIVHSLGKIGSGVNQLLERGDAGIRGES